jgi:glycosyltransferase involved in cell wall biosynthesis
MSGGHSYAVVIATLDRPGRLAAALESVAAQARAPREVTVVDASAGGESQEVVESFAARLPVHWQRAEAKSAARQRNQGAEGIEADLIAFIDDDVVLAPDLFQKLCEVFDADTAEEIGGVAARMRGGSHPRPRGLLWWYYRLQAGYADPTYGGRLFGPGINCFPCFEEQDGPLIRAEWLNSGCVMFRTALFNNVKFPLFDGYSFMEDVHLSAMIGKTHRLLYHAGALYDHFPAVSAAKADTLELARHRLRNQRALARDVLGRSGPRFEAELLLHRLFVSISIARRREPGWQRDLLGTWLP